MNKSKIEHYHSLYLDMLRTKAAQPHRSLLDMLEIKLRADVVLANGNRSYSIAVRDLENPVQRFDQLGLPTDELIFEFVPARVWAWAEEQMPDPGNELDLSGGLIVRLSASTKAMGLPGHLVPQDAPSTWLLRQGPADEFLTLLRGIQAYQRKRRKRARRLLAQLGVYHWQFSKQCALQLQERKEVVA
jgi:hypothetical protein